MIAFRLEFFALGVTFGFLVDVFRCDCCSYFVNVVVCGGRVAVGVAVAVVVL